MAESTLAPVWDDLMENVAWYLGYGRKKDQAAGLTAAQETEVQSYVDSGYRQFLFPPAVPPDTIAHRWSFLYPLTSLTAWKTATGTMTITDQTILTDNSATFYPSMVGATVTADTSGNEYTIAGYTSATVITVATDASGDTGDTYTITATGTYRLPDDFGNFWGELTFQADEGFYSPLAIISEAQVRALLQGSTSTGRPTAAGLRPIRETTTAGQRFDVVIYPIPDSDYPLYYRYAALVNALSSSATYALGGMAHGETLLASCFAVAENRANDEKGVKWDRFIERLRASIDYDKHSSPEHLGFMRDPGNMMGDLLWYRRNHVVTVGGVAY